MDERDGQSLPATSNTRDGERSHMGGNHRSSGPSSIFHTRGSKCDWQVCSPRVAMDAQGG
jgi:hypothetical protein